ncbi:hypothetical protein HK098_002728 [Nowakowskiella sp. JEL0407]|nr:hypothetical protein HK098_002728 [Nowakowskiella sp. JEL0407]
MSRGGFFPQNLQQPYEYEEDFGFASKIDELMDKKFELGEEFEEEEDYDNADTFGDVDDTFGRNAGYGSYSFVNSNFGGNFNFFSLDKDFDFTAGNSFFESKREEEHGKYVVPEFEDNHNDEAFGDDIPISQDFKFSNVDVENDEFQKFKQQQQLENQEPKNMWGGIQENLPETQKWPEYVNDGTIDSHPHTLPQPSNVQPKTIQEIEAQMLRSRNNQNHAINAQAMYLENLKLQQQSRQEALTLAEVEAQLRMQQQHQHQQQASMHMHPNVMPMEGLQGIQDMARISQIQQQRIQQLQQMQFQLMQQRQLQQMEFQRLQMLQEEQQGLQRSNSLTGNQGMRQHPNPLLQQPQQFAQPQFSQQARQTQSSPQPRPQFREQQYRDQQYSTRNPPARQQMRLYNAPQSVHTQGARGRNEYIHLQNRHLEENRSLNGYGRDAYIREDKRSREVV